MRVLAGEPVWPPPIWLMRQAGRYLPEYRAVRAGASDFIALCTTPDLATEVTLQPIRRFGFDAAILFSDILILPWALGYELAFKEAEGPVLPQLATAADVEALEPERLLPSVAPVLETVRHVRAALPAATALIGFAGAPFTVACYMIEGGGSADFARTRKLAYAEPALMHRLIDRLTDTAIAYLGAQIEAGADIVMLFDSWAGVLSTRLFRDHVIDPTRRIAAAIHTRYASVPVIGFPRLAGLSMASYATGTGVDCVGMDTSVDPVLAATLVGPRVALQGNLDPMALVAGGAAMERETEAILVALRGRPHVFNLGHGILPQTSPEHVGALVDLVRGA
jgi:uroporphyrinogen decarboxylase